MHDFNYYNNEFQFNLVSTNIAVCKIIQLLVFEVEFTT